MPSARLKFNGREITIDSSVITLGRASDNDVSFSDDSNISRYHAEIESRFGDYWLIDLGSSNGTTVNGQKVGVDLMLKEGDQILLGGSSQVVFTFKTGEEENPAEKAEDDPESDAEAAPPARGSDASDEAEAAAEPEVPATEEKKSSKMGCLLGAAGILGGLAIVFVIGAVLLSSKCGTSAGACQPQAVITKPEVGDTISKTVKIEVETKNDSCVESAVFMLDGKEFVKAEKKPFEASLNPAKHARLADGFAHKLSIVLYDKKGNKITESGSVPIAFETREIDKPKTEDTPDKGNVAQNQQSDPKKDSGGKVSVIETKGLVEAFMKQFSGGGASGNPTYRFDPQFFQEVQNKTSEYASAGFFARAAAYKDVINEAYVKEQDLDPALGYILAMSRTQFILKSDAAGDGLWRMPGEFVSSNGYDQLCGENKSLSDPAQICAAKASSLYLKALVTGVFEGDLIYSVAAFGKSPQAANIWKGQLPANRADFWNIIKTRNERDQIVRFFAAAAVAQNPEKFGLKNDRPLFDLYSFTLRK